MVFVVEKNVIALVIIKKVVFQETEKFISGCSQCFNLNDDFLIHLESSFLYNCNKSSQLFKCNHILEAIASILDNFNVFGVNRVVTGPKKTKDP